MVEREDPEGTQTAVASTKPRLFGILGPGLITGASDDDPSGIATYSQAGAQFGFALNWTMFYSLPLMVAIQMISARIGRTTGRGIAGEFGHMTIVAGGKPCVCGNRGCWEKYASAAAGSSVTMHSVCSLP